MKNYLRSLVQTILEAIQVPIDFVYTHLDLWSSNNAGEVDYSKLRGVVLFTVVCAVMILIVLKHGDAISSMFYVTLIAMLSLAAGERLFLAFLKGWAPKQSDTIFNNSKSVTVNPAEPSLHDDERDM